MCKNAFSIKFNKRNANLHSQEHRKNYLCNVKKIET